MRFRPAPLRQAAIVAAVFVVARVVYRAVFAGAGGSGIRLLDLPLVTLPAPFSGVAVLGPVTSGGLVASVLSALPFAGVILAFGALNALVDVRPLFAAAARRGPVRSLSRALVIAWQTLPALTTSVGRAARAARLRGERPGPSVLVPVLEGAIERGVALAASLELRGFAADRGAPAVESGRDELRCAEPVRATDALLERDGWRLAVPSLALDPGTLTVLTAPTGSGKSSVLDALSGLFQHVDGGRQSGSLRVGGADRAAVPPRETAGFVGAVAQQVRDSFVGETVAEEIGTAMSLRGVAPVIVRARVREVATRLGIDGLLERDGRARGVAELSAGETVLVALGAAIVENPTLLLVDEPLAELDELTRPRVVALLGALAHEAGMCVVVAEHRVGWFRGVADGWLTIAAGQLSRATDASVEAVASGNHFSPSGNHCFPEPPPGQSAAAATMVPAGSKKVPSQHDDNTVIASVRDLSVRYGERVVVDRAALELLAGELVALTGPNGAGKSSLLAALAEPPTAGSVLVRGSDVRGLRPAARHSAVALVPEAVEELFVTDSVAAECRRTDRRGRPAVPTLVRFGALLGVDPSTLAQTHPRDLSGGQRMCLAIALQLAGDPAVLLVDEPVRGLDAAARAELTTALRRAAAAGASVLFATHERDFADAVAQRTIHLDAGRVIETVHDADQGPVLQPVLQPVGAEPSPAGEPSPIGGANPAGEPTPSGRTGRDGAPEASA